MDVIMGRRGVLEVLNSERRISEILLARDVRQNETLREIEKRAAIRGIGIARVERKAVDDLTGGGANQGIAALVEAYSFADFELVLDELADSDEAAVLLALDGVTDPHNVGALVRTADATGVSAIILPGKRSASITPVVFKASAGAVEHVRIVQVVNLVSAIKRIKQAGFWVYGADVAAESSLFEIEFDKKSLLVLGSEGAGLSRLVKESCDFLVSIPMAGRISSLNVSVAGALLMYEVFRKRASG